MRFGRDFSDEARQATRTCGSADVADPALKIIGRSWSFRGNDKGRERERERERGGEGRGCLESKVDAKHNHCSSLHPPLNAVHHAAYTGRTARGHDTSQSHRITWREQARRAEGCETLLRGRRARRMRERERGRRGGGGGKGTRTRRERSLRVPRGEVLGLACPGMASSHSSVFTVRGHPRARATFGFSTSYLARVADAAPAHSDKLHY